MIIGFGHKARQGKDFLADYLVEHYGFKKFSFAYALKKEVGNPKEKIIEYDTVMGSVFLKDTHYSWCELKSEDGDVYNTFVSYMMKNGTYNNDTSSYVKYGSQLKDRELLQIWGTDFRRNITNDNYWVSKMNDLIADEPLVAISDMRFKNEFDYVKKNGFTVNVDGRQRIDRSDHLSETDLDNADYDYKIVNDGTREDAFYKMDLVMIDINKHLMKKGDFVWMKK